MERLGNGLNDPTQVTLVAHRTAGATEDNKKKIIQIKNIWYYVY